MRELLDRPVQRLADLTDPVPYPCREGPKPVDVHHREDQVGCMVVVQHHDPPTILCPSPGEVIGDGVLARCRVADQMDDRSASSHDQ